MRIREWGIRAIRGLMWLAVVSLGLPMLLRFVLYAAWIVANGLDGAGLALCLKAAVDLLPLGVCAAMSVTTLLRLLGRKSPAGWWIAMTAALAALCMCLIFITDAAANRELTSLPLMTAGVLAALNGLLSLANRTPTRKER